MKRKTPHGRKMLFVRQQEESDKLAEAVQDNFSGIREAMNELSHSVLLQDETILLGRKLEGAAGQGTSDNGTKRYERYRLRELLREYRKINGGYSDILVYFSNDDYIVASDSANTLENYRRAEEEKYGEIGSKEWETLMKGKHPSLSMMTAGEELTFFVKTIQESKWDRSQINIVFVYEQPKLQNLLFFSRNTGSRFLLWHTGETEEEAGEPWILKSTEYADLEEEDRRALEGAARNREGRVRLPDLGQEAWFHYYSLGEGYELAVYGIQEDYLDSIRDYQVRTVFLLSGFTIASVLLMLYFLRRNYSQVEGLLGMLEISARDSGADNEFQMIGGRLSQIKENLKEADNRLERQNLLFKRAYLEKLLQGNVPKDAEYVEELYKIKWLGEQFTVLLFYAESIQGDDSDQWKRLQDRHLDLEFVHFILGNVCQELFENRGVGLYPLSVDSRIAFLLNFPEKEAVKNKNIVLETVAQLQEFLDAHLEIQYLVASGEICSGREGIADAYQQALYVMETKRVYELEDCLFYADVQVEPAYGYYYPLELERELISQIQKRDVQRAWELIEGLFAQNERKNAGKFREIQRYLAYDIQCTMLKALEGRKLVGETFFSGVEPGDKKYLEELLDSICHSLQDDRDRNFKNNEEMCDKILSYIRQNIGDCNLNVTSIAGHFQISSVEMSKTFRVIKGQKLPTYISALRLERAKEILLSSELW